MPIETSRFGLKGVEPKAILKEDTTAEMPTPKAVMPKTTSTTDGVSSIFCKIRDHRSQPARLG